MTVIARNTSRPPDVAVTATTVAVCVLTYRRPHGLRRALDSLLALDLPTGVAVDVVVVDNDAAGSGRPIVEEVARQAPFPVRYGTEPRRSISAARNRAIELAGEVGYIAFVDDDEWVDPDWLGELLATQRRTGADVVTATVLPVFEHNPPAWVTEGRFFERPGHAHDELIGYATTSNVLIRRRCLDLVEGPFDEAFGLSGGSDTHLFAQLAAKGCRIAWCARAPVYELIPSSRVSLRWILRREYRRGQTLSLSLRARRLGPIRVVRRVANGCWQIVAGVVLLATGIPRGRAGLLRGVHRWCFGSGMLTGLVGMRHLEYRRVHGG